MSEWRLIEPARGGKVRNSQKKVLSKVEEGVDWRQSHDLSRRKDQQSKPQNVALHIWHSASLHVVLLCRSCDYPSNSSTNHTVPRPPFRGGKKRKGKPPWPLSPVISHHPQHQANKPSNQRVTSIKSSSSPAHQRPPVSEYQREGLQERSIHTLHMAICSCMYFTNYFHPANIPPKVFCFFSFKSFEPQMNSYIFKKQIVGFNFEYFLGVVSSRHVLYMTVIFPRNTMVTGYSVCRSTALYIQKDI